MAACGGLQYIFEKPLPENPTLLESLSSWNQIKPPAKPIEQSSFTEIFGELHFKENYQSPPSRSPSPSNSSFPNLSSFSSPSSSFIDLLNPETETAKLNKSDGLEYNKYEEKKSLSLDSFPVTPKNQYSGCHRKGESFSSMNYESLQLCTEGLGFESSDEVEDLKNDVSEDSQYQMAKVSSITRHLALENPTRELIRRSRTREGVFPPPIPSIGKSGKPSVCFRSYRHDGRFVLKEVRFQTQEFLHACREDGRLKLHFVQPNNNVFDEAEDDDVVKEEERCAEDSEPEENEEEGNNDDGYDDDNEDIEEVKECQMQQT